MSNANPRRGPAGPATDCGKAPSETVHRNGLSRRQFLGSLGALGLISLTGGCETKTPPLVVSANIWQGYEPLFLAKQKGWIEPDLIRLSELPSTASSVRALKAGIVDGAALTLDEMIRARAEGIPLIAVLVFDISNGADMLLVRPEIEDLKSLDGKRVGVDPNSFASLILYSSLAQAGLSAVDLIQVPLGMSDQILAWEQGKIDAIVTYDPVASRLKELGARTIYDSSDIPNTIVDVLAVRTDRLGEGAAKNVRHLIEAHFRALDFIHEQKSEASVLLADHMGIPPEAVASGFNGLILPDVHENRRLLQGGGASLMNSANKIADLMLSAGILPHAADMSDLFTDQFLPFEGGK